MLPTIGSAAAGCCHVARTYSIGLALHQEPHPVHIHEADFAQIEDDASRQLGLDNSPGLRPLLQQQATPYGVQTGSAAPPEGCFG
jgi:hypothetical protein